jgi:hypothetical protein
VSCYIGADGKHVDEDDPNAIDPNDEEHAADERYKYARFLWARAHGQDEVRD